MTATSFREGVEAQPENLRVGAELARQALAELDLRPLRSGTVVFSGIGASWYALLPTVRALRAAGRRAFAVPAGALTPGLADAYVLVSQSGASTETLEALEAIASQPVVAVSARGDTPLAERAGSWLPLGPRRDSAVSTLAYTATLQTLGLLCDAILDARDAAWEALPGQVAELLVAHDAPAERFAGALADAVAIDAVGAGAAEASAGETALLAREALQLPGTGAETRQYLHGPLEAVTGGYGCFVFGRSRELQLAAALAGYGARVAAISDLAPVLDVDEVSGFRVPAAPQTVSPVLQIVPVQLIVAHAAAARGLQIDVLSRQQPDTKVAPA
jgi:glucosamine--fructose-6-phosphate aminotransferase (isomerizing)